MGKLYQKYKIDLVCWCHCMECEMSAYVSVLLDSCQSKSFLRVSFSLLHHTGPQMQKLAPLPDPTCIKKNSMCLHKYLIFMVLQNGATQMIKPFLSSHRTASKCWNPITQWCNDISNKKKTLNQHLLNLSAYQPNNSSIYPHPMHLKILT